MDDDEDLFLELTPALVSRRIGLRDSTVRP
jgi:hypothetical protein